MASVPGLHHQTSSENMNLETLYRLHRVTVILLFFASYLQKHACQDEQKEPLQ